jgi:hypothetical protein
MCYSPAFSLLEVHSFLNKLYHFHYVLCLACILLAALAELTDLLKWLYSQVQNPRYGGLTSQHHCTYIKYAM